MSKREARESPRQGELEEEKKRKRERFHWGGETEGDTLSVSMAESRTADACGSLCVSVTSFRSAWTPPDEDKDAAATTCHHMLVTTCHHMPVTVFRITRNSIPPASSPFSPPSSFLFPLSSVL
jgi:hypothetical protein